MRLFTRIRLAVNDGVIGIFLKHRRRDLAAEVAVDTGIVNKEPAGTVFQIGAIGIGHRKFYAAARVEVLGKTSVPSRCWPRSAPNWCCFRPSYGDMMRANNVSTIEGDRCGGSVCLPLKEGKCFLTSGNSHF